MNINIITAFPDSFDSVFSHSIIKRALDKKLAKIIIHDLRKWTTNTHKTIDGSPYGGGAGMVLMIEPIHKALNEIRRNLDRSKTLTIVTSAKGELYNQAKAKEFSTFENLIIICGHYEGIDQRVIDHLADLEISVGKYVLTGGEIPAMIITDTVVRLLPGVLGNEKSLEHESFNEADKTEAPQYTRPAEFLTDDGELLKVPDVLLSGNHQKIEEWRKLNSVMPTSKN